MIASIEDIGILLLLGLMIAWVPAFWWFMFSLRHKFTGGDHENSNYLHLAKVMLIAYLVTFLPIGITIFIATSVAKTNTLGYRMLMASIIGTVVFWIGCWIWSARR